MKQIYKLIVTLALVVFVQSAFAQNSVTELITDFGGYWRSGAGAINSLRPNNSHNVVSFSYNGQRYSTGVDDALLNSRGLSYVAGNYRALPMENFTGAINNNTKVGLGEILDGISNGPSSPTPEWGISKYLTDGKQGLDIGTCIANLPAGNMMFPATSMKIAAVGDGVPDLLITQIADPSSSSLDKYEFTDINGNRVGNSVDIVLNNIAPVGNWTADFYEASSRPLNLIPGFTKTDRPIRLWAADFSAFGINASNISQVAYFKITLNGNSDVAFVAYNTNTLDINASLLPTTLKSFTAKANQNNTTLTWETATEIDSKEFVIEASNAGSEFRSVATVAAAGNSFGLKKYQQNLAGLKSGKWMFRLKMVDINGHARYSSVQVVTISSENLSMSVYPNPATNYAVIDHASATGKEFIQIWNMQGIMVQQTQLKAGTAQTRINLHQQPGVYQVKYTDGSAQVVKTLLVK